MKFGYTLALAGAGAALAERLGSPGIRVGGRWLMVVAPVVGLAAIAGIFSAVLSYDQMHRAMMGHSWRLCPWRILALAVPTFAAAL